MIYAFNSKTCSKKKKYKNVTISVNDTEENKFYGCLKIVLLDRTQIMLVNGIGCYDSQRVY